MRGRVPSTSSPLDARATIHRAAREHFLSELRTLTNGEHFTLTSIACDARYSCIGNWLYVSARQACVEDRIARFISGPGVLVMSSAAGSVDESALAMWALQRFDLKSAGALVRLLTSGDEQLRAGVHLLLHQEVFAAVRFRYRDYRHVSPRDVAHQLLHENLDRWSTEFDPSRGSLAAYLSRRVGPNQLRRQGARSVGLVGEPVRPGETTHDDPLERVLERVDAERSVPPRANWPEEVQRQFAEDLTPSEAADVGGIAPNVHRSRVSRYVVRLRREAGALGRGNQRDGPG